MRIQVPVNAALLADGVDAAKMHEALTARFAGERFVRVRPLATGGFDEWSLDPTALNDTNAIELSVVGHPSGHVLLSAVLDNLG